MYKHPRLIGEQGITQRYAKGLTFLFDVLSQVNPFTEFRVVGERKLRKTPEPEVLPIAIVEL